MAHEWLCIVGETEIGPISSGQVKKLAVEGKLRECDLVKRLDWDAWRRVGDIKGLFPRSTKSNRQRIRELQAAVNELSLVANAHKSKFWISAAERRSARRTQDSIFTEIRRLEAEIKGPPLSQLGKVRNRSSAIQRILKTKTHLLDDDDFTLVGDSMRRLCEIVEYSDPAQLQSVTDAMLSFAQIVVTARPNDTHFANRKIVNIDSQFVIDSRLDLAIDILHATTNDALKAGLMRRLADADVTVPVGPLLDGIANDPSWTGDGAIQYLQKNCVHCATVLVERLCRTVQDSMERMLAEVLKTGIWSPTGRREEIVSQLLAEDYESAAAAGDEFVDFVLELAGDGKVTLLRRRSCSALAFSNASRAEDLLVRIGRDVLWGLRPFHGKDWHEGVGIMNALCKTGRDDAKKGLDRIIAKHVSTINAKSLSSVIRHYSARGNVVVTALVKPLLTRTTKLKKKRNGLSRRIHEPVGHH